MDMSYSIAISYSILYVFVYRDIIIKSSTIPYTQILINFIHWNSQLPYMSLSFTSL